MMSTETHRHTYYGGPTTTETPNSNHTGSNHMSANGLNHRNSSSHKGRRRQVTFGPYIIGPTLGEGEFGKVKLGWSKSKSDESKNVAIKLIRRDTIPKSSEKEVKIYREINALKHLTHPNIVTLEEVLQNSKYIGIVLHYASGGEFYKYIQKKRRLKEPAACRLFAQLISGVHYMHHKGLAHRDLKLENLLLDEHENLIITDFGFVNEFSSKSDLMKTSCGSPCYAAPELVVTTTAYQARKADVWSCGVILYAMLAGYLPWDDDPDNPDGDDIAKLYNYITKTPLKFPEYVNPVPRDILRRTLISDPAKRITVQLIEKHQWLHPHSLFLSLKPEDWDTKAKAEINNIFRPPPSQPSQSRYSRPHSNSSVSSSEKRNSLIIDSTLHLQPVPPQESQSHAIAKPSSPSSDLRSSPIKRVNHSRSNSAASIALQAVVDSEREFFQASQSNLQNSGIQPTELFPNARAQNYGSTRLITHNNSTSLMNRNSMIVEVSPNKEVLPQSTSSAIPVMNYPAPRDPYLSNSPIRNPIPSPKFVAAPFTSSTSQHGNKFGSSQQSRPRPTSYHPISSSYMDMQPSNPPNNSLNNNNEFSYIPKTTNSNTNPDSTRTSSPEVNSNNIETSPSLSGRNFQSGIIRRGSFSASKPTPTVDLNNAEGDLIKTDAEDHKNLKQQRRKSRRYSTVILDNSIATVHEETEDSVALKDAKSGKPTEPLESSPEHAGKVVDNDFEKVDVQVRAQSPLNKTDVKLLQKLPVQPQPQPSVVRADPRPKKEKRFSLLSFYSYYNNSKTSVSSDSSSGRKISTSSQKTNERIPSVKSNSIQTRNVSGSSRHQEQPKPRVPSNASNRTNYRNSMLPPKTTPLADTSVNRMNRASVMVSSVKDGTDSSKNTNREHKEQREPGTAKRVFDFFKRRSMRI
ncbi:unnamed protein product [Kluyveromyces dobzhanskii CBS 2104]|uniref:non-specific serine/threonine protein kinase n=1 Tax=Kluyveromyces dobzhanskii CBS 2104 TaxID=1427455 RepID=A0A0A8L5Y1_9SACH|nr:unnamed protein product [Kluyveromyces dobzhanskii CBS 2104]